jgi:hypothetical protein
MCGALSGSVAAMCPLLSIVRVSISRKRLPSTPAFLPSSTANPAATREHPCIRETQRSPPSDWQTDSRLELAVELAAAARLQKNFDA